MKTSAISPIPSASVMHTPNPRANHPAALIPASPKSTQALAIHATNPLTTRLAMASSIQLYFRPMMPRSRPSLGSVASSFSFTAKLVRRVNGGGQARSVVFGGSQHLLDFLQVLDEQPHFAMPAFLVRRAQQRGGVHGRERIRREARRDQPAAFFRHAKCLAEQRLRRRRA